MKTIEEKIAIEKYESKAFDMYFGNKEIAVFDIETTGLFPGHEKIILTGILLISDGECKAIQYFADKPDDEKQLVSKTIDTLKDIDVIITYNGRSFDMPFLKKRAEKLGVPMEIDAYDLDLYAILSGYSGLKGALNSLSQKSIEHYMGFSDNREDEINGYESIRLYEQYMASKSFALENKILLHNHDDIIQLYRIMPVLANADLHRAAFHLGFPAGNFMISKCKITTGELLVTGHINGESAQDYISFPTESRPYSLMINASNKNFELTIPAEHIEDSVIIDASKLLCGGGDQSIEDFDLDRYPSFESGYLILKDKYMINYLEVNVFIIKFMKVLSKELNY